MPSAESKDPQATEVAAVIEHTPGIVHDVQRGDVAGIEHDIDYLLEAEPAVVKEAKAGYKTTEFWLTLVAAILTQVGALHLPGKYGDTIATVALLASYALSRGIAKSGVAHVEDGPAA
jgi:hypothetical protein